MDMMLLLSLVGWAGRVDPPTGGVSPLAWVIVTALAAALVGVSVVALRWVGRLYDDLKACNAARAASEEDVLGMLKVLRMQMERSKGGKPK
jgi:hypothetical protein